MDRSSNGSLIDKDRVVAEYLTTLLEIALGRISRDGHILDGSLNQVAEL